MTAALDAAAVALLHDLEVPCDVCNEDGDACGDPAAWIVTFMLRVDGHRHGPILFCLAHYAALTGHRQQCRTCPALYDVRAEELR